MTDKDTSSTVVNLQDLTVSELKDLLDEDGIKYTSRDTKQELISKFMADEETAFSKKQLLNSGYFTKDWPSLLALLEDDKKYTLTETREIIEEFKDREVKL